MGSLTCKGVLFDLDGTLVDSTASVSRVWGAWAVEHGIDPEHAIHIAHGRPTIESVRLLAPQLDEQAELREIERRELADADGLYVFPGAVELLTSLPAERWAIVTSGTRALATTRLRVAELPIPELMITANEITRGKPDPEPYRKGAELLNLSPQDCVAFEDAPAGIKSAKAAGMPVLAVPTTYPASELGEATTILPRLEAVTATFDGDWIRLSW